jgi:hypothetical protein
MTVKVMALQVMFLVVLQERLVPEGMVDNGLDMHLQHLVPWVMED